MVEFNARPEFLYRLILPVQVIITQAEFEMSWSVFGFDPNGLFESLRGIIIPAHQLVREAHTAVPSVIPGFDANALLVAFQRIWAATQLVVCVTKEGVSPSARLEPDRCLRGISRLRVAALLEEAVGKVAVSLWVQAEQGNSGVHRAAARFHDPGLARSLSAARTSDQGGQRDRRLNIRY